MDKQIAEKIIMLSKDLEADASEVFLRSSAATTIEIKDQKIDAFERARDIGAGLRVIVSGRLGFAFTTDFSDGAVSNLVRAAVTNAQNTEPDDNNHIPGKHPDPARSVAIYDPNIVNLTEREKIDRVMAMERETFAVDPRIKRIRKASAAFSETETYIFNSEGADVFYRSTACSASVEAVAEEEGEAQSGSDFDVSRFYHRLAIEEIGRRSARRALDLLGARRIESVKAPVVLEASVAQEFLSMMAGGFSAESVQKKRSLFTGKLDTEVVAPIIAIHDDGLLDGGLGTAPSDDEAVPTEKKVVIQDGRLVLFLHNTYTARKDKTRSTGNAVRGGFKGIPGVGITNLFIEPGKCSLEGLINQAGRGLLVTDVMGMHTANPISGDFSVGATGFWIESGEKVYPVREITIAGNILDVMKNVDAVGNDLRFSGRIGSPSLLINTLSIGGK